MSTGHSLRDDPGLKSEPGLGHSHEVNRRAIGQILRVGPYVAKSVMWPPAGRCPEFRPFSIWNAT